MENLFEFFKKQNEKIKGKPKMLLILGLSGIVLIYMSTFFGGNKKPQTNKLTEKNATVNTQNYVTNLENNLREIVNKITGTNKSTVFVTLNSGVEYVYANEIKSNFDSASDEVGSEKSKIQSKESSEDRHVIVKLPGGGEEALIITELSPKIRGVVVVCDYGDNEDIKESVEQALVTALDISKTRVCVTNYK